MKSFSPSSSSSFPIEFELDPEILKTYNQIIVIAILKNTHSHNKYLKPNLK